MAADATTAMTIDFLRARLLSERSVSRAAKERADQLAKRVAELEEQLRTVTTKRRKAERAAAEVLAILESQGFGRLSDAADSCSDDDTGGPEAAESSNARGEAEDTLSDSESGGPAAAPQVGGLSWKGRAASPDSERRQPHPKGKQPRQRHGHSHRRSYFYLLTADSSPKYQPGQSCRKIKRKELRLQNEGEEKDNVPESLEEEQERSNCTVCNDEQHYLDGEVIQNGQGSCGDGRVEDGSDRYTMEYEKDGDMERVLEKQAELIGQYEAEENAQREWEKKFSGSRDSSADDVDLDNKLNQIEKACEQRDKAAQIMDREVVCEEARSSDKNIFGINSPSECLLNSSVSGLPTNAPEESAIEQGKIVVPDHDVGQANADFASIDSESQIRMDGIDLVRPDPSPRRSYHNSTNAGHNTGQGDENSDSSLSYHANAYSSEHYINTPSDGSPLSDTPNSEVSEWSSSCFHNHTDNQIDRQLYQQLSDDVGGVLEALQRAKMSLREKLSRPSPPSQDMLALTEPEDGYTKDDLLVKDTGHSLCMSRQLSQEILALPASGDYLSRISLPQDDAKVPVGPPGLFRLPTDSFPQNEVYSTDSYGSRFSLEATSQHSIFSSNPANRIMSTPSVSQYGSGFSPNPYYDPRSSILLSMPNAGGCSIPVLDFKIAEPSFTPEILRPSNDLRRGVPSGDADVLFQHGGDYT